MFTGDAVRVTATAGWGCGTELIHRPQATYKCQEEEIMKQSLLQ